MAQAAFPLVPGKYYVDGVRIIVLPDKILVDTEYKKQTEQPEPEKPQKPKKSFKETVSNISRALDGMNSALSGKR